MPLATRQSATRARTVRAEAAGFSSTPPVTGAPNTRTFLAHCRDRAVTSSARRSRLGSERQ